MIKKFVWFNRPGIPSTFTPSAGIVQECKTSAAVTKIRIWEFIGTITRLSTSNNRNSSFFNSFVGIIYESNSILLLKSEYS